MGFQASRFDGISQFPFRAIVRKIAKEQHADSSVRFAALSALPAQNSSLWNRAGLLACLPASLQIRIQSENSEPPRVEKQDEDSDGEFFSCGQIVVVSTPIL